jgi:hypothetical protein
MDVLGKGHDPCRSKIFFASVKGQSSYGAHTASNATGSVGYFSRGKAATA